MGRFWRRRAGRTPGGIFELHKVQASPIAAEALKRIGSLYAIEAEVRGKLPDHRRRIREAQAGPLLDVTAGCKLTQTAD